MIYLWSESVATLAHSRFTDNICWSAGALSCGNMANKMVSISVSGHVHVLGLRKIDGISEFQLPIVFNVSYI